MKFHSLILGSLVLAQASIAAPVFCSGGSYSLVTDNNLRTATLSRNEQPVQFGDLHCRSGRQNTLVCSSINVADAGYTAVIKLAAPGVDTTGELSRITFAGSRKITDLKCVSAANELE